jgi:hypothetical protein
VTHGTINEKDPAGAGTPPGRGRLMWSRRARSYLLDLRLSRPSDGSRLVLEALAALEAPRRPEHSGAAPGRASRGAVLSERLRARRPSALLALDGRAGRGRVRQVPRWASLGASTSLLVATVPRGDPAGLGHRSRVSCSPVREPVASRSRADGRELASRGLVVGRGHVQARASLRRGRPSLHLTGKPLLPGMHPGVALPVERLAP